MDIKAKLARCGNCGIEYSLADLQANLNSLSEKVNPTQQASQRRPSPIEKRSEDEPAQKLEPDVSLKASFAPPDLNIEHPKAGDKEAAPKGNTANSQPNRNVRIRTCPICKSNDQIQRVSSILDTQVSDTTGTARTSTVGFGSGGGLGYSESSAEYQHSTATKLAQRFEFPKPPSSGALRALITWLITLAAIGMAWTAITGQDGSETNTVLQILMCIVAAIPAAIDWLRGLTKYDQNLKRWQQAADRVRSAYYCPRDDVAFSGWDDVAMEPREFVRLEFKPPEKQDK